MFSIHRNDFLHTPWLEKYQYELFDNRLPAPQNRATHYSQDKCSVLILLITRTKSEIDDKELTSLHFRP